MNPLKVITITLLIIIAGFGSTIGFVGSASANQAHRFNFEIDGIVSGGGIAGTGSLAVAAIFSVGASSGAGAFSGDLHASLGYDTGLFRLTVSNPANAPVLPCPTGQLSAGGIVVSGSFLGEQVIVAACLGSPSADLMIFHSTLSDAFFAGNIFGPSSVSVSSSALSAVFAAASATLGSGSAGSGTIFAAEADGINQDGTLVGGGALTGAVSDINVGSVWQINKVSFQPGCTLTTSGFTAPVSFPGEWSKQPFTSSYMLVTCPPSSAGPQTARPYLVVGGYVSPIYKGTGSAIIELFAFLTQ